MHTPKHLPILFTCIIVLIQFLLLPQISFAKRKTIIFATPKAGWPPYIIPQKDIGCNCGIMPEIFKEICTTLGYDIKIQFYPEKRSQLMISEGRIDALPKSPKWVADPTSLLWSIPVLVVSDVIVYRKNAPIRYTKPRDLKEKSIGVIHGFTYPTLEHLFQIGAIRKQKTTNTKSLILMLSMGYVDGIVTSRRVAEWIIRKTPDLDIGNFGFSETAVDSAPYTFAFAKGKGLKPFVAQFNKTLRTMQRDGRIQKILDKYR